MLNSKFDEKWFEFLTGCSMYLYISHYFWIAVIARAVIFYTNFSFVGNVVFLYVFTIILVLLSYTLILKISGACCKKKPIDDDPAKNKQIVDTKNQQVLPRNGNPSPPNEYREIELKDISHDDEAKPVDKTNVVTKINS